MTGGTLSERQRLRNLLKQFRKKSGLTQVDLAERLGKPQSYVSKYELGKKTLDFLEVKEICESLGLSIIKFLEKIKK